MVLQSSPTVTVCTQCEHFRNLEPRGARRHVWYNHICRAFPRSKVVDPYDGKMRYTASNDMGRVTTSDQEHDYCRDHNDGKCPAFKQRYDA